MFWQEIAAMLLMLMLEGSSGESVEVQKTLWSQSYKSNFFLIKKAE